MGGHILISQTTRHLYNIGDSWLIQRIVTMSESQSLDVADVEYDGQEIKAATMESLTAIVASEFGKSELG